MKKFKVYKKDYRQLYKCDCCEAVFEYVTNHNDNFFDKCKKCGWHSRYSADGKRYYTGEDVNIMINIETEDKE